VQTLRPLFWFKKNSLAVLQAMGGNEHLKKTENKRARGQVGDDEFLVSRIVDHSFTDAFKTAIECLVKWHRWTDVHNSVVPLIEIGHDSSLVRDYIRVLEKRKLRELYLAGKLVGSAHQLNAERCCSNCWLTCSDCHTRCDYRLTLNLKRMES